MWRRTAPFGIAVAYRLQLGHAGQFFIAAVITAFGSGRRGLALAECKGERSSAGPAEPKIPFSEAFKQSRPGGRHIRRDPPQPLPRPSRRGATRARSGRFHGERMYRAGGLKPRKSTTGFRFGRTGVRPFTGRFKR